MTAENTDETTTDDPRDIAEELLAKAATIALALVDEPGEPHTAALIAQTMALAGAGYTQLAGLDWAQEQANRQASLFGELLAEFRSTMAAAPQPPSPTTGGPADFLIDSTDDRWTHTGNGLYESKQDPGLYDVPIETIRERWGPVREYVLRPSRPDS